MGRDVVVRYMLFWV